MTKRNRIKHPQGVLMRRTRELLNEAKTPYIEIYRDTGIQPSWLTLFAADRIPDPSVNTVERLYTHLNGGPLVIG